MEFKLRIATSQHICLTFLKAQHTEKSTESSTSHHKVNISMKSDPHGEPEGHQRPRVGPSSTGAQSLARTPWPWLLKPLCHRASIYSALGNAKWLFKVLLPICTPASTEEELYSSRSSSTCRYFLPFSFQPFQWARGGITLVFISSPW